MRSRSMRRYAWRHRVPHLGQRLGDDQAGFPHEGELRDGLQLEGITPSASLHRPSDVPRSAPARASANEASAAIARSVTSSTGP